MKKILSIFLVLVMLFTSVPMAYAAEDGTTRTETQSQSQLTAENGMTNIINNLTQSDVPEEDSGFSIRNVAFEDGYAYVNINVAEKCNLVVAIYDEDTFEMLGTGKKAVEASVYSQDKTEDIIEVKIDIDSMPDQFLAKVFLLDDNYNALCKEYVCRDYTTAYINFMDTTPNDFPNSEIVAFEKNYDDFGVIADDVIVLENVKYTYENGTYTFDDANEQLSSLDVGDVIYIPISNEIGDFILIKVATIEKNGTSIVITNDEDIAIGDAFRFVRIDADADFSNVSVDEENLGSAIEIIDEEENGEENGEVSDEEGEVSAQSNERSEIVDDSKEKTYTTKLKVEYPKKESDDKTAWESGCKVSAELEYSVEASARLYYDLRFDDDFYEFKTEINHKLTFSKISFSGELKLNKSKVRIPIPDIPIGGIFELSIDLYPVFSTEASITLINLGLNIYNRVSLNDSNGFSKINETKWLDMDDPEIGKTKVKIKIGVGVSFTFGVQKGKKNSDGVSTLCASVSAKVEGYVKMELEPSFLGVMLDKHHDCNFCLSGSTDLVIEGTLSFKLKILSDKLSWEWEALKVGKTWPKGDSYLSINSNGISFGFGPCENISYAVTVTVNDSDDEPIKGATVSTTTGFCDDDNDGNFDERSTETDKNGQATFYFKKGKHTITAENNGVKVKSNKFQILSNAKSVTIKFPESTIGGGSTDEIVSGSCGANVAYTLNKTTGELIISGTGPMEDYAYFGYDSVVNSPFIYNDYIKTVVIRQGVTSIGDYAFWGCMSLESITIPDSVTSIGDSTFNACISLESITLPDSVTSIVDSTFNACISLESITIPDSVTSIGNYAFYQCESLTNITIPDSVKSIGFDAFYNTAYYNDSSNWEDDVLYIGNHLIKAKTSISENYTIKSGTKCIADHAFDFCNNLTRITIPDSVTSIDGTFYSCSSLTSITIPDSVTSIGDLAFAFCTSLKSITIPDSVTSIGDRAFYECIGLTNITIPDGVTRIGDRAFENCDSLTSITIPESVKSIGRDAFYNTAYYNDSSNWENDVLYIGNRLIRAKTSISGNYTIKSGTKYITNYAFENCGLTRVTIPDSVTRIGACAFENCNSLTSTGGGSFSVFPKVKIPDSVTYIGGGAFSDCSSLRNVEIPDSVTYIGGGAFDGCGKLTRIYVSQNNENYLSEGGVLFDKAQTILIKYPEGKSSSEYIIPSSVTSIGYSAFENCDSLTSITIPDSVTYIGDSAFWSCDSLTDIDVSMNNEIYSSKDGVLFNKTQTILIKYPEGKSSSEYIIPSSVTSIGNYAFENCGSLTSIRIPDSVTSIGSYAFYGCIWLESIIIPDSVTSIGNYAFYGCYFLKSIIIPDGVTSIGHLAFAFCTSLESITIPDSVKYIDASAFAGSRDFSYVYVYYNGTQEQWNDIDIVVDINNPLSNNILNANIIFNSSSTANQSNNPTIASFSLANLSGENLLPVANNLVTKSATKTDTLKGSEYVLLVVKDADCDDMLSSDNLLYIDQKTADGDTISFDYVLPANTNNCTAIIYGPMHTHTPGEAVKENEVKATCKKEGSYEEVIYCTVCGCELSRVTKTTDKIAHTEETISAVEATCEKTGLTEGTKCSVCGDIIKVQEIVAAKGHKEVIDPAKDPTCDADGLTEGKHCDVCGKTIVEQISVPATGFVDEDGDGLCDKCGKAHDNQATDQPNSSNKFNSFLQALLSILENIFRILSANFDGNEALDNIWQNIKNWQAAIK